MIIKVVKYNPDWVRQFELESSQLKKMLGDELVHIHHIGSTAVPGLQAKPVIDIILEVRAIQNLDNRKIQFEALGYEVMGEYGIPGRRYFRKGGDHRTHHIHAFQVDDSNILRHLAFRDYLIEHDEIAKEYGALKVLIAKRCNNNNEQYCDEKDAFVKEHEQKALAWYGKK